MVCLAAIAATGGIAYASMPATTVRTTGVPTLAQCDDPDGDCYVGVGEYALHLPGGRGDTTEALLGEAEAARLARRSLTYQGRVETDGDGRPVMRRGRPVLLGSR